MPPPTTRRAPYKDFLQPCMQRRFASTLAILLAVSYIEAITLSSWDSVIWSWFPLGIAGLRTLIIFSGALVIVVLRIAHPHIGIRTTRSPIDTFRQCLLSSATLETIITYTICAACFSQVYLLSVAEKANLHWITFHSGDRARLNERALFYTVNMIVLGVAEGVLHLALDYDSLRLGLVKAKSEKETTSKQQEPLEKLLRSAPRILVRSLTTSIVVALVDYLVLYSWLLRRSAWGWAMSFFRPFYNLPKSNIPPVHAPWSFWMLARSILAGFMLCVLWNVGNAALTFAQEKKPFKNGRPLTWESKDPNGSLLNGLKSKKPHISAFAMWELALTARDCDLRRKAIFEDIDRKDGPVWSQIYVICMNTIKLLEKRIDDYGKPVPPPSTQQKPTQAEKAPTRIVEGPLSANVWQKPPPPKTLRDSVGRLIDNVVRSPGKKPADALFPLAKKTATDVRDSLLTKEQQDHLNKEGVNGVLQSVALGVFSIQILGWPFRQGYSRRLAGAVFGLPYGDVSLYVNAAFAVSQLAVKSIDEDQYGSVQRDVPALIRTLTIVIRKLEAFRDHLPPHWTDRTGERKCQPVEELLAALKDALLRVVDAFESFSSDLRLTRTDIRLAKEAAVKKVEDGAEEQQAQDVVERREDRRPEMTQVR